MMKKEHEYLEERKLALKYGQVEGREILDIGAGPLARMAVEQYDCFVTSIDISPEKLDEAGQEATDHGVDKKISFELADVTDLPFEDESFDIGIVFGTLHHLPPKKREIAIRELARVVYERILIVEFTPEEFAEFHADEEFEAVDLEWLEENLAGIGTLTKYPLNTMNIYIVEKQSPV